MSLRRIRCRCVAALASVGLVAGVLAACSSPSSQSLRVTGGPTGTYLVPPGIH
jgi:hypothetical protein